MISSGRYFMVCRCKVRDEEAPKKARHVKMVRGRSNGGCDAPISKLLEGLHKSGVEGARADDMPKLAMTRALYHSRPLKHPFLHVSIYKSISLSHKLKKK
jgi:hypothetical protein